MNFLSKSEYWSSLRGLSYIVPIQVTFLDIVDVNFYCFISMQKMTSDFFVLDYLRTLFEAGGIVRLSRKCEENREQLVVLNWTVTT
jgi:hypothetical protein